MENLTPKQKEIISILESKNSFSEGLQEVYALLPKYPERPRKPILKSNHTYEELKAYNSEFKDYETKLSQYKAMCEVYTKERQETDQCIEVYIRDLSGLNNIPEKYRDKVYYKAYEDGHSSGFSEIYNCLCNLVDIFE